MKFPTRSGLIPVPGITGEFAPPYEHALGNDVPPQTGTPPGKAGPGPGKASGGQVGGAYVHRSGADPRRPVMSPAPRVVKPSPSGGVTPGNERRWFEGGVAGFNDQLRHVDRHAYWDTGTQRTGNTPSVPGNPPNPVTDGPTRPDLRLTQRSLTWQIGSDATRNQDDLSRPYTWLGEQGSGWIAINGGVPGLYQPYGTRGGVPYAIVSRAELGAPNDGRELVFSGPPHGLHSDTLPDTAQTLSRYYVTPQMRPVRMDRPDNSPQAGQSYSQTVQFQGQPGRPSERGVPGRAHVGRGWAGSRRA